jgi:hypothetical protein
MRSKCEKLSASVAIRAVRDPTSYGQFAGFSSGGGEYERIVDRLVLGQHQGVTANKATMVVMEDTDTSALMGVCGLRRGVVQFATPPPSGLPPPREASAARPGALFADAIYVHVIGLSEVFRGHRLADGSRLGACLLRGALARFVAVGPIPIVWAYVAPNNYPCHRMFEEHDFGLISPDGRDADSIRFRPGGLRLSTVGSGARDARA